MDYLPLPFLFLFGAVAGSFLNVCIYRIPRGESIVHPPSHCPACGRPIRPSDNIPILSYIILKGRCRECGWRIPARYPLIEGISGLTLVLLFVRFGWSLPMVLYFLLLSSLIVVASIDLKEGIIPDIVTFPLLAFGLFVSPATIGMAQALLGALFGGGVLLLIALTYYLATGREGMGGGDVKLLAMIGAFLGWKGAFFTLFLASLFGSVIGISLSLMGGEGIRQRRIPFGPFLSTGAALYVFFGSELSGWLL